MADQTVKIEGDSGSPAAIGFRVWQVLRHKHGTPNSMQADIDLFVNCVDAAHGRDVVLKQPT